MIIEDDKKIEGKSDHTYQITYCIFYANRVKNI